MTKMRLFSGIVAATILAFSLAACRGEATPPNRLTITHMPSAMWDEKALVYVTATGVTRQDLMTDISSHTFSLVVARFDFEDLDTRGGTMQLVGNGIRTVTVPLFEMNNTPWNGGGGHLVWVFLNGNSVVYRTTNQVIFRGGNLQIPSSIFARV